jgi:general secretion pathway protein G
MKQFCDSAAARRQRPISRRVISGGPIPAGESGLTLIEMMIVLVIIAIVAGLLAFNMMNRPDEARATAAKSNLTTISAALKMYRLDNGDYPTSEQGLKALVERPATEPVPQNWAQGGYLSGGTQATLDPWGHPYSYALTPEGFVVKSLGKDGKEGGEGINADIERKD